MLFGEHCQPLCPHIRSRFGRLFQSPFSSGRQRCQGGTFSMNLTGCCVSIPFSSGRQRCHRHRDFRVGRPARFNPLLIGAAALPERRPLPLRLRMASFNPLLIGAAALPPGALAVVFGRPEGFNPLLIGAAALPIQILRVLGCEGLVSIPFSSGRQRCHSRSTVAPSLLPRVSIPFSSGRQRCPF